jgi:hypothetical protein
MDRCCHVASPAGHRSAAVAAESNAEDREDRLPGRRSVCPERMRKPLRPARAMSWRRTIQLGRLAGCRSSIATSSPSGCSSRSPPPARRPRAPPIARSRSRARGCMCGATPRRAHLPRCCCSMATASWSPTTTAPPRGSRRPGVALAVTDYRGYGQSTGASTLRALISDARLVADAIRPRLVMRRSLGGVAAHELYAPPTAGLAGVVLESGLFDLGALVEAHATTSVDGAGPYTPPRAVSRDWAPMAPDQCDTGSPSRCVEDRRRHQRVVERARLDVEPGARAERDAGDVAGLAVDVAAHRAVDVLECGVHRGATPQPRRVGLGPASSPAWAR